MDAISYTAASANLASTMKKVCDDHSPVVITRENESPVVMLSLEDYQTIEKPPTCSDLPPMSGNCLRRLQNWNQAAVHKSFGIIM